MKYSTVLAGTMLLVACATSKPVKVKNTFDFEEKNPLIKPDSSLFVANKTVQVASEKEMPRRLAIPASALPSPALYVAPASQLIVDTRRSSLAAQLKQVDSLVTNLQHEVHKDSAGLAKKLPEFGIRPPHTLHARQTDDNTSKAPAAGTLEAKNVPVTSLKVAARLIKQKPVSSPLSETPCRWELNSNIIYLGSVLAFASIFFTFLFTKKHYEAEAKNNFLAGHNN